MADGLRVGRHLVLRPRRTGQVAKGQEEEEAARNALGEGVAERVTAATVGELVLEEHGTIARASSGPFKIAPNS